MSDLDDWKAKQAAFAGRRKARSTATPEEVLALRDEIDTLKNCLFIANGVIDELRAELAQPQADHSPDAGKMLRTLVDAAKKAPDVPVQFFVAGDEATGEHWGEVLELRLALKARLLVEFPGEPLVTNLRTIGDDVAFGFSIGEFFLGEMGTTGLLARTMASAQREKFLSRAVEMLRRVLSRRGGA